MQKVEIAFYDDLDYAELREMTRAARTVIFAVGGREFELDLTEEHAGELEAFLDRYAKAGRRRDSAPDMPGRNVKEGRAVGKAKRAFGDSSDDPAVWYKKGDSGSYHYSRELDRQFAALAEPAPAEDRSSPVS